DKPVDYAVIFAVNRRHHGVLLDEAASRFGAFEHPIQRLPSGSRVYAQPESLLGGNYSSWRPDSGNESGYSPFRREKLSWSRRGKDGALRSLLPPWYTRTPLRDINHIIRLNYDRFVSEYSLKGLCVFMSEYSLKYACLASMWLLRWLLRGGGGGGGGEGEEEEEEDEMATKMATEIRGRRRRRKRADMGGNDGLASETPTQQQVFVLDTPVAGVRAGDGLESETPTHQQLGVLETPACFVFCVSDIGFVSDMGVDDGLESETPTQQQVSVLETLVSGVKVGDGLESETPTHQQLGVLESPVASADDHNSVMVTHTPAVGVDDSLESDSNSATSLCS
ncbi:unnamed protein product, partial [Brassica napus]